MNDKAKEIIMRWRYENRHLPQCKKKGLKPVKYKDYKIVKQERDRKFNEGLIKIEKELWGVLNIFLQALAIFMKAIVVGILGMGLFFVIYILNKPFGAFGFWYSVFASYTLTGIIWSLIPDFSFIK